MAASGRLDTPRRTGARAGLEEAAHVEIHSQRQAASALNFLYRDVLKQPIKLPEGIARLLYGSGLRLLEALRLRTKDLGARRLAKSLCAPL